MRTCSSCAHANPDALERCAQCGTLLDAPPGLEAELLPLIKAGRTIDAIRIYRERTGAGLKEGRDAVEALAAKLAPDLETELLPLLKEGRKIEAIKIYRERTGRDLKDAKEAVDALAVKHGAKRAGCAGLLLALLFR